MASRAMWRTAGLVAAGLLTLAALPTVLVSAVDYGAASFLAAAGLAAVGAGLLLSAVPRTPVGEGGAGTVSGPLGHRGRHLRHAAGDWHPPRDPAPDLASHGTGRPWTGARTNLDGAP